MTPKKRVSEFVRESTASSTAQTASLSNDVEMVYLVLMSGLFYLTREGWSGYMKWMRQDEMFSGLEEVALKHIFVSSIKELERRSDGTSGKTSQKPAAS